MRDGDRGEVGREDGGAAIAIVPRRERRHRLVTGLHQTVFQFTPREGSDLRPALQNAYLEYFNPRSREGSDQGGKVKFLSHLISIHAPVKGATAKITKTIPNDFYKINNYNNSFA